MLGFIYMNAWKNYDSKKQKTLLLFSIMPFLKSQKWFTSSGSPTQNSIRKKMKNMTIRKSHKTARERRYDFSEGRKMTRMWFWTILHRFYFCSFWEIFWPLLRPWRWCRNTLQASPNYLEKLHFRPPDFLEHVQNMSKRIHVIFENCPWKFVIWNLKSRTWKNVFWDCKLGNWKLIFESWNIETWLVTLT